MSLRAAVILAAAALALAGCGEDKEGSVNVEGGTSTTGPSTSGTAPTATTEVPPVGAPVATINLEETDFELAPKNPLITKPGIVLIEATNAGKVPHAIEVEGPDGEEETPVIAPGKKANLKVDLSKDGTYTWYCPVGDHRERGMEGKITVGKGGATTEEEPETDSSSGGAKSY
jgi:plastocyanin